MNHEAYKEMLPLEAFDALDGEDALSLRAHLEACADCRAEADELRSTAAMLAHTVAPVAPPEHLRALILSSIKTSAPPVASDASANRGASVRQNEQGDSAESASGGSSNVLLFDKAHKRRTLLISKPVFAFGAIAASLLIVALAATLFVLRQRNQEMRDELARLNQRADELAARANQSEQELARNREEREMLTASGAQMVSLAGTKAAPGAHAMVAFDPHTGRALLLASNLPPAPAGKAYQLWFIAGGRPPMPGKVFSTDSAGRGALRDQVPSEAKLAPTFAVTLEPAQGVNAPTSEPYLVGKAS